MALQFTDKAKVSLCSGTARLHLLLPYAELSVFTDRVSKGNGQQEVIQWGSKRTCATGTSSLGESSEGESSAVAAKQQLFKAK